MSNLGKMAFIFGAAFLVFWYLFVHKIILQYLSSLGLLPLLSNILALTIIPYLLLFILELEIFIKLQILQATPKNLNIKLVSLDNIYEVNHVSLNQYTRSLKSLGFVQIADFQEREAVIRVLWHPEYQCGAEILQSLNKTSPYTYCGISNIFEQGWAVAFLDNDINQIGAYALRVPKRLTIFKSKMPLDKLLKLFLEFRKQMMSDLNISIIKDVSIDLYLDVSKKSRRQTRQKIIWTSIIFMFIEMSLFSMKTDDEKYKCLATYTKA
ncbi:hypothetical protein DSM106972_013310 [Dulcicalothrix desertica PCC 7102]|uniref:Uncharacterized protein n=1 Tax=Dulcicalothrix desertica PCC 7102 TaxID=232991 RepID=A0A3S1AS83_9CYAN|nr:hypothetical protein [Dulcicalothrix desertica]RUT08163.1 hypothetical protein DSM106972_013310 [Dulcicalothrix desertica PCC 7102]TWH40033.1 hypothetical protein CAL7102_09321 [Dulcicalothrix desertica PCC 7102]